MNADVQSARNDAPKLIPHLLEQHSRVTPHAPATEDAQRALTYAELAAEAEHMAARLAEMGVLPGDRVGVMMRHSADLLVAILGVLRARAAYVPIDPDYPDQRKGFLAADSGIKILIVDGAQGAQGTPTSLPVTTLAPDRGRLPPRPGAPAAAPDDLACVIYTSGSTGAPKGVMITHLGLANLAAAASAEFGMGPRDRYLMLAASAFSASLEELFPPLVQGGTSVFPADRVALSPVEALLDYLTAHEVTLLEMQTAHWHVLVRHLVDTGGALPPSLRLLVMGGDRAMPEAVQQWNRFRLPLVHVYGPTETTATASYWTVPPGQAPKDGVLSMGDAIAGTRMFVVDERLELVPADAEGELLIGGDSLARGYLGRPDVTAERFVADRYSGIPGARLYRTGDRVRRLPDGRLQFLGRGDQQVKVRGYRVEPGEIEAALDRHPAVRQALVTTGQDASGERRLIGYVTADRDKVSVGELRSFLADELPAHLIPSALIRLDEFPLTTHRKIDHAMLPQPPKRRPDLPTEFVPPTGEIERRVGAAAAELLGLDEIGVLDNLLDLGGDSLFMLRLISWIRTDLGISLGFREVFDTYSVRGVAALAEAKADVTAVGKPGSGW
ncbi:non-ribosomal peptide synthetase [Streptomyces neyagawaensis]|uniref:non-ribosomal peptide synthetase n=1 Tax=Streptomyces neyagawaensis TaxID=42238 RepID=UPI00099F3BFC|nr:non-ribosomal peptide synthetase [Streptomyces neyagawaensis]MCL6733984.1 non-ribosomal peptide synthetase [Streptomyces neyagawaensis]MDE1682857.1 non-ribosomal peptide synthetase [Streptomyces neyagawaensis]